MKVRDDEWTRRWKSVPAERRRRIARAVMRGEAVVDPRDAPLAIELSEKRQRQLQSARTSWVSKWLSARHFLIFGSIGVIGAVLTHNFLVVGVLLLTALYLGGLRAFLRRLETHAAAAREKNEQIARLL